MKIPNYNYNNQTKALYCVKHKLPNMIDIKSKRCQYDSCMIIPSYNYKDKSGAIYYAQHKPFG
jgi:hypothetical protein